MTNHAWSAPILTQPHAIAWGYQGWLWQPRQVHSLFARVESAHRGESLLDVASRVFQKTRCYEAMMYWEHVANPHEEAPPQVEAADEQQPPQQQPRDVQRALDAASDGEERELIIIPQPPPVRHARARKDIHVSRTPRVIVRSLADGMYMEHRPNDEGQGGGHHGGGLQGGTHHGGGHPGSDSAVQILRVVSPISLIRVLNGTCAYLPVWPTSLEFFTSLLVTPQPMATLEALARWITHHGVSFLRVPDLSQVRSTSCNHRGAQTLDQPPHTLCSYPLLATCPLLPLSWTFGKGAAGGP